MLILNMTICFSNSCPKMPKASIFVPQLKFVLFYKKLWTLKNLKMLISNMTQTFLKNHPKDTRIRQF